MMQAREELIESVCQKEVGVYQQIFSTTGPRPDHVTPHKDRRLPHLCQRWHLVEHLLPLSGTIRDK